MAKRKLVLEILKKRSNVGTLFHYIVPVPSPFRTAAFKKHLRAYRCSDFRINYFSASTVFRKYINNEVVTRNICVVHLNISSETWNKRILVKFI